MDLTPDEEKYLNSIYFDPSHPGSFGGEDKLYKTIKEEGRFRITHKKLRKWLSAQETYTLHRPARRNYSRRRIIVGSIGKQADADLIDIRSLSKFNDNYSFILLYIDIFSKYIWTQPLKTKSGAEVVEAFKKIYDDGGKCEKLRTDRGTEFLNQRLKSFLLKQDVHHFVSENPSTKANVAERAIKSIKLKLYKYMNQFQTFRYIDVLQKITRAYNETFHRSIQLRPSQVTKENQSQVWMTLYRKKPVALKPEKLRIKVGDWVRVSNLKKVFDTEYHTRWSSEQYLVVASNLKQGRAAYTLQDFSGEVVSGTWYSNELQLISLPSDSTYKIERIIKSRKLKGKPKQFLVKWLNWGKKWNSWVNEDDLMDLPKPPD